MCNGEEEAQPKGIDAKDGTLSGFQAVFKASDCKAALESVGRHEAAGNLFWLNLGYTPTPGAPYNVTHIMTLKLH